MNELFHALGLNKKAVFTGVSLLALLVVVMSTLGINNNGYRTVVQWPNGTTFTKFTPGMYISLFGTTEEYPDVMTFDYEDDTPDGSMSAPGVNVRYQDGGTGTTYGKLRIALPSDEEGMLKLHRAVRSPEGLASRLLRPTVKEAHNMTAGLMSSEAAYAEQRGTYTQWVTSQLDKGPFKTKLNEVETLSETGDLVIKKVPVIRYDEKQMPIHTRSVFADYGLTIASSQVTNWSFEAKTLKQISDKRNATMAIITAKAEAERAKQDAITAEEKGKANVMSAKYEKEQEKIRAVVDAEKAKEVAVIAAEQQVSVAEQVKLEQEQLKLAAYEEKKRLIALGQGEAERKRLVMQADGALQQKLDAYIKVNMNYANALTHQKWVPEIVMGTSGEGNDGSSATDMINLLTLKAAKDLSLDLSMKEIK